MIERLIVRVQDRAGADTIERIRTIVDEHPGRSAVRLLVGDRVVDFTGDHRVEVSEQVLGELQRELVRLGVSVSVERADESWPVLDWTLKSRHRDQSLGPPLAEDDWPSWWMSQNWSLAAELGDQTIGPVTCLVLSETLVPGSRWLVDVHGEMQFALVLCDSLPELLSVIERFRPLLELSANTLSRATSALSNALRVCLVDSNGYPVE